MTLSDKPAQQPCGGDGEVERISCEEALRLVHEFLDGELEDVTPAQVHEHFEACRGCYPHLRLEQAFREAMKRACASQTAPAELKERVARMLSESRERR